MRFLAVLPLVPYPPDRGDRMRAWEMITALSSFGHLTVAIVSSEAPSTALTALRQFAKDAYWYRLDARGKLLSMARGVVRGFPANISRYWSNDVRKCLQTDCRGPWDLILAYQLRAVPYVQGLPGGVRILDLTDSLSLYRHRLPWRGRSILHRLALTGVDKLETRLPRLFDMCWVSASDDAARLKQLSGISPRVVPNGCFPVSQPAPYQPDGPVVFMGDMRYPPNEDAILSFAHYVWPLVRQRQPHRRLRILGRPTRAVLALNRLTSVEVTDVQLSLERELQDAGVVINPVRFGTGSSRKILDAWAAARPVVSTRAGARGLPCRQGAEVLLADTLDEWLASLSWLTRHPAEAEDIGRRGWTLARAKYDAQVIWRKAFSSVLDGMRTQPETERTSVSKEAGQA